MNVTPGHVCRECKYFLYPEKSLAYKNETFTQYCPYSCHRVKTGGYASGGQTACASFQQADQLSIEWGGR